MDDSTLLRNVLIALPIPEPTGHLQKLRSAFPDIEFTFYHTSGENTGKPPHQEFKKADAIFSLFTFPSSPLSETAPHLKWAHTYSAGVNFLAKPGNGVWESQDVLLSSSNGVHGPQITEWWVMTALIESHRFKGHFEAQKRGAWGRGDEGDPDTAARVKAQLRAGKYLEQLSDPSKGDNSGKGFHEGGQQKESSDQRAKRIQKRMDEENQQDVQDMVEQRVGILGYGSIGRQIARVASAMGMTVVAYTSSPRDTPESRKDDGYIIPGTGDPDGSIPREWYSGADKDSLHKFLGADLDYLVVAVPLTEKTHHMLSTAEFQVLSKRRAFISNIARGQIIDQAALIAALQPQELENPSQADKSNRMPRIHFNPESLDPSRPNAFPLLRGAALDVTDPEPLQPECPLWYLPHVTITPHISGLTTRYTQRTFDIFSLNLARWQAGKPLINQIESVAMRHLPEHE